ncbi:MAG: hypothetical protein VB128_16080 [Sedimentibacter saalensis]|uniref:hypothetical protein n=1 Tax=Sedimentibacter saalensis TaxID=130788 RepID=UPI002B21EFC0|nr:hypothetical protein [Sedimentibacter saalensis]MEA5096471.1 hypothetical protein [Sedimentibacter saalensis]
MTLKDIFYNKLLELLRCICNKDYIKAYYERNKDKSDIGTFMNYANSLEDYIDIIEKKKIDNDLFVDFEALQNQIVMFRVKYSDYEAHYKTSAEVIICILEKIVQLVQQSDVYDYINNTEEIDVNKFLLFKVDNKLGIENFFYFDSADIDDAVVLITFDSLEELKKIIIQEPNDAKLLTILLEKIEVQLDANFSGQYSLFNARHNGKWERVKAYIELLKVAKGDTIHKNHDIVRNPVVGNTANLKIEKEYQQFSEAIYILSEYNDKKDILDKFLRIYQVIENFMYRKPICMMINSNPGKMFSIREFKALYSKVKESELASLEALIKEVFSINYSATKTFKDEIYDRFRNFICVSVTETQALEGFLPFIGITNSPGGICSLSNVKKGEFDCFLSKLIYMIRCSIVHNKETEYHISHYNYPEPIGYLLNNFLLSCLEEVIFYLIINKEPIITYSVPKLSLF